MLPASTGYPCCAVGSQLAKCSCRACLSLFCRGPVPRPTRPFPMSQRPSKLSTQQLRTASQEHPQGTPPDTAGQHIKPWANSLLGSVLPTACTGNACWHTPGQGASLGSSPAPRSFVARWVLLMTPPIMGAAFPTPLRIVPLLPRAALTQSQGLW